MRDFIPGILISLTAILVYKIATEKDLYTQLREAVDKEAYELAAVLRDRIKALKQA